MTFLTAQRQLLFILIGCFALGLGMAGCGGGGGGGGGDQTPPLAPTMVAIQGATHAGTLALPLALAECRFEALQDKQQLDAAFANIVGTLTLQVPPGVQGFVRCNPSPFPRLVLSAFVSTTGQAAGDVLRNENITPATTVIADHIEATAPADPQARKVELLNDLAMGEPNITALVEAATLLYQEMLKAEIDSTADFSGDGESANDGEADDGGASGEAGDGGEFSPLPGAVCEFSLDLDGKVRANTILADLYADGRVDRLDLQAIANRVNTVHSPARQRGIAAAFAALFPNGLGRPIRVIADGSNSSTPGAYFLPYPAGVPGVIQCRPADQDNLVLTTCVPARLVDETLDAQDVTPVSTVVCGIVTAVQQAQSKADRDATQDELFRQLEPLRIFLSEDRNGNGIQDLDEIDKNGDDIFATIVEIESDVPLTDDNRKLALLASMSTTIFDTMRIEADSLPVDATFEGARAEFFTNGRFSEPLVALEPGVADTLDDTANQVVLGTTDVVSAATTGSLRGTVMDEGEEAVAGVQVIIFQAGVEVDVEGNPAVTEADGTFQIDNIPVGETTVVAFFGEFEVLRVTTNVVAIVTIDLEIMPTPEIQVSPSSLVFGDVEVGSNRILPVTLTNTGVAALTVNDLQVDGPAGDAFILGEAPTLPVVISPGSSVVVEVIYQSLAVGSALSTLRVSSDAFNAPEASVALIGNAVPQPVPQIEVSPLSVSLGEVELGADRTRPIRIRNTGTAELSITSLAITSAAGGAFALSNPPSLPVNVTPGAEVTVPIRYRPQVAGSVTGALRVFSNAEAMPQVTVALSGTGVSQPVPEIEVSRSSLAFGAVQVRAPGDSAVTVTQSVQIRNMGNANLMLTALGIESSVGTEFTLKSVPALPVVLTPLASVNVEVEYRPETIGTITGALHIRSNADNISDVTVALTGTGVPVPMSQIIASTPVLAFGEMQVGSTRMLEVSLTNTGTENLTLLTAAVFGNAAFTLRQAPTFPITVSPNASVALQVQYQPNAEGSVTGVLRIESDADNTPNLNVPLSGTGASVPMPLIDVNPLDIAFAEVEVGGSRIVPVTIINAGTADLRVIDLILTTSTGTDFSLASAPQVPVTVQPNAAITLDVRYAPMAVGSATGTLRIENNSLETPAVTVALSGTGVAVPVPQLVVSPPSVSFGEVALGGSQAIAVTISNAGNADLTVTDIQIESGEPDVFRLGAVPMPPVLVTPGAAIPVQVIFEPMAARSVTGTLQIMSDVEGTPLVTVPLSGTGRTLPVPLISVSPPAVVFGDVQIGMTRALEVTINNTGTDVLVLNSIAVDGPANAVFRLDNAPTPPVSIQPGAALPVEIIYAPELEGLAMGTLEIESNASNTPLVTVGLNGNGVPEPMPQIAVSPALVDFSEVQVGATRALTVTVTNPGTAELTLTGVAVDGGPDGVFFLGTEPTIPVGVAPGDAVLIEVMFAPVTETSVAGTLTIESEVAGMPVVTVPLNGTGVATPMSQIDVNPAALAFGDVSIGSTRLINVTITNLGTAPLSLSALTVNGPAFRLGAASGAPVVVEPASSVTAGIVFEPSSEGPATGTLEIGSDASNASLVAVPLSGNGVAAPLPQLLVQPAILEFGGVEIGQFQTLTLSLSNPGNAVLSLADIAIAEGNGAGFALSAALPLPIAIDPTASLDVNIRFEPVAPGTVTGTLQIDHNIPNIPSVTVSLTGTGVAAAEPGIGVDPAVLAFSEVEVGQSLTLSLSVSNPGTSDLLLTALTVDSSAPGVFGLAQPPALPVVIAPGEAFAVDVIYQPVAPRPDTGTLQIDHNVAAIPEVVAPLSGTGVVSAVPQIVVAPVALDFGEVQLGESSQLTVTIRNNGTGDLNLDSVVLEAPVTSGLTLSQAPTVLSVVVPGGEVTAEVEYLPTQEGAVAGTLRILSDAANAAEVTVLVSGTGVATPAPQIAAVPAALVFGDVQVNDTQVLTVTLSNPGTSALEITGLVLDAAATSGFVLSTVPTTPVLVVPDGAVTVDIAYMPSAEGPVTGTLRVQSNAVNGVELPIALSGTGVLLPMPQLVVAPVALDFDEVAVGQQGALTVTISNPGTGALEISAFTLDALEGSGFALSGVPPVPATVAAGETLEIGVTYTPTAEGTVTGAMRLLSNALNTPEVVVPLQGTGVSVPVPQISVQPAALSFGAVSLGSSVALPLTLQNVGSAPLNIAALTLESEVSSGFALVNVPVEALVVLPGESFGVEVTYTPTAAGTVTGTVRIQSNAVNAAAVTIPLSGTGMLVQGPGILVLPAALDFGEIELGQNLMLSVEVRNAGTEVLDLTEMVLETAPGSGFTLNGVPVLPTSLDPGASLSIGVVYAPISAGPVNSQIRLVSNAVNAAAVTIPLSGTGMLVQGPGILVLPAALDFGEVVLGQNLTLSVEVRNAGTEVLDLTGVVLDAVPGLGLTLSGVPTLPTSLDLGASFSMDVGYAPPVVGPVNSQLRIVSNAVNGAEVIVPVVGIGRVPEAQIEVLSAALDFGEVELGQNLTLSVEIRNVGDADLEWRSVVISAAVDTEFVLGGIPGPVAPGDIAFIDVTYQPTEPGPAIGSLQLQSNAVNTPQVSVTLSGTGVGVSQSN